MTSSEGTLTVKAKKAVKIRKSSLKKKAKTIRISRLINVRKHAGTLTYKKLTVKKGGKSFKKYFTVNTKTGTVKVKKNTPKGTYKLRIRVTDAGSDEYEGSSRIVTCTIKIK